MLRTEIETTLQSPTLDAAWEDCRSPWPELPADTLAPILADVLKQRDQFLRVASEISDLEQLDSTVAMMYLNVRSQWEMVNTQIAYQTQSGLPDPKASYQSSLLCSLLQALESLLPVPIINRLSLVVADPLATTSERALEIEFGTVSSFQIITETRRWKDELADLTRRLADQTAAHDVLVADLQSKLADVSASFERMQANQANLRRELGTWESNEIIDIVRAARDAMAQWGDRLLLLETNHATLERELGTGNGEQIAASMRKLSAENEALRDVADLFGAMEDDLKRLEVH